MTGTDVTHAPKHRLGVEHDGHVAIVEFSHGPHNHLVPGLVAALADRLEALDGDDNCRAIVLASEGRSFCAGADFAAAPAGERPDPEAFYTQAMRLFDGRKPIVAAVHGAAIGAGLGLAMVADFRVGCEAARFSANFNRLGIHPGFGLSLTLPRLVGMQQASLLFFTGRRIDGQEAHRIGLVDVLVDAEAVRRQSIALAHEIATSAPLAVQSTRASLRAALAAQVREANRTELQAQRHQFASADFREGVAAMAARRQPVFTRC
ncbi:enoyl-CoA hydratase/isomerase family protein [Variovorax sp. PDNC026]|uniref:enoyl-CoA hydratase/isomerase family protein n=1 Tax=Variovorax sp. PDNC026 TaxID=2811425 RepID=UPI001963BBDA|nr:enoyl-CoA hydratase/isomerase family protein [Variovorax sp. PDNC026]QRY34298.1 enoyl-CoA hydratase/isomerase family protein [Variovorax sp. PDNC026]